MTLRNVTDFPLIEFSDGQIRSLEWKDGNIVLVLQNWREQTSRIIFHDAVGFEAYSPLDEDLSHGTVDQEDPFIEQSCSCVEESSQNVWCFSIWSAWRETPLLRITAVGFEEVG